MARLFVYQGLPASGKSTEAKRVVSESNGKVKRLNKDDLRSMIDAGKWSKEREKKILEVRDWMTQKYLNEGFDVIWDDTNLAQKHIQRAIDITDECSAEMEIVDKFLDVPIRECIHRDAGRPNPVGEKVITDMYFRYIDRKEKYQEKMYEGLNLPDAIIVDIDGTVAIHTGRSPYDLTRVKEDLPNLPLFKMLRSMQSEGVKIIFVSGREGTEQCMYDTIDWLNIHIQDYSLFMRKEGDSRKDSIVKKEIFLERIDRFYNVLFVIDDRDQTVDTWRSLDLQCWQVNYGSF